MAERKASDMAFEKVLQDPTAIFDGPRDVLASDKYSKTQKREILENWELDANRLQESAEESMTGGEPARLAEVQECMRQLDSDD